MPAVTRVLSSGFFIPADTDSSVSSTKATVGLGLNISTELLRTTFARDEVERSVDEPTLNDSHVGSTSSPPLLPTRLSRRSSPTFPVESDYYPMSTPSPSIRGMSFDAFERILDISLPVDSPVVEANVGLGNAMPCWDASELATKVSHRDPAVGLGFDLPCLAERELVTIIRPTFSNPGIDFSLLEEVDITDAVTIPALDVTEDSAAESSERSPAGLGLDSPFWRTYDTVLTERFD